MDRRVIGSPVELSDFQARGPPFNVADSCIFIAVALFHDRPVSGSAGGAEVAFPEHRGGGHRAVGGLKVHPAPQFRAAEKPSAAGLPSAMNSPFPGMDPYLEERWRDVHQSL